MHLISTYCLLVLLRNTYFAKWCIYIVLTAKWFIYDYSADFTKWIFNIGLSLLSGLLYPHHKMWGGGLYWIRFIASVGWSVRPSPICVRSITPLLMEGFPSNLNDTFTSTKGCGEPILSMCQLKVKVTVKYQILIKPILHIMSCPLYNSFTNERISFKLE